MKDNEIIVKADIKVIKRWLVSISNDKNMSIEDRWLANQTLNYISN